jgi:hypothetical protein
MPGGAGIVSERRRIQVRSLPGKMRKLSGIDDGQVNITVPAPAVRTRKVGPPQVSSLPKET